MCVTYCQADVCTDAMIVERSQLYENDTNRYSAVQYRIGHCSGVQYSTVQYNFLQYSIVQSSTVKYSEVLYSTAHYCIVHCSTVQYSAIQYGTAQYSVQSLKSVKSSFCGQQCYLPRCYEPQSTCNRSTKS